MKLSNNNMLTKPEIRKRGHGMKDNTPIAVTSRSFSQHQVLRSELLALYSDVRFNDEGVLLDGKSLIAFARGRRKIITALERIDETILSALPELEVISKYGVGTDTLEKSSLIQHGIRLGWSGGTNKRSVAELTVAFMISLLRRVFTVNSSVREGSWENYKGQQLSGRTVGIIGCGHIGKDLTVILQAFGCNILTYDILDFPEFYAEYKVEPVSLEELLQRANIVSLHVPLNNSTRNILTAERLALMQPNSILINTARGSLVDETALKYMLSNGLMAGAGFDVFSVEPPEDIELLRLPNFLATPHIGGSTEEAILAMGRAAIRGLDVNSLPSASYPP